MKLLLKQFLEQEATPYVRKLIFETVIKHAEKPEEIIRRFEFNRFEITLNFSDRSVLIEDVLESGPHGEMMIEMDEFMRALD
jgi:acetyl/propionyl-CoA carboxylase alpha subunit